MDLSALLQAVGESAPMPFTKMRPTNPKVMAHIDGDYAAYFCAGGDGCSAGDARRNVLSRVSTLKAVSGAAKVVIHLTHGASTKGDRFLASTTQPYQGQRNHSSKPANWAFLREWMEGYDGSAFETKVWTAREADDGMAFVCESAAKYTNTLHAVHTADKDMRMFAGLHVAWKDYTTTEVPHGAFDVVGVDGLQYGHKWFWCQMLQGDAADSIPGLPRVGKETAAKILAGTECNADAAERVFLEYEKRIGAGWRAYFAEQAVLLWMRTDRSAELLDVLQLGVFSDRLIQAFRKLDADVSERRTQLQYRQWCSVTSQFKR